MEAVQQEATSEMAGLTVFYSFGLLALVVLVSVVQKMCG